MHTSEIAHDLFNDENAGWSRAGARALAEYLEQLEEDTGEEMEFDRVAIRCDFSEYDNAKEAAEEYPWEAPPREEQESDFDYAERVEEDALEWLQDRTSVIEFEGGVIIQNF